MAKAFAKRFYNSKSWKECRKHYIDKRILIDGGMCEMCGIELGYIVHHKKELTPMNINNPNITLNENNLQYVCKECHDKKHFYNGEQTDKLKVKFDNAGNPIKKCKVYLVYGSPGSGKSTYVEQHKETGDLIIDYDNILYALSGELIRTDKTDNLRHITESIMEYIYTQIEQGKVDTNNIYITGTYPYKETRLAFIKRLNAKAIYINKTYEECVEHIMKDYKREDKDREIDRIKRWFLNFEP